MTKTDLQLKKVFQALEILQRCMGKKGVWADPSRYAEQCWTRDFGIAIQPVLHLIGKPEIAKRHLENLSARQRLNGQIPILFLDDEERWRKEKERKSAEQGRRSFMLGRYHEGELWNLTPGTRDSEILYILAMHEYAEETGDSAFLEANRSRIQAALNYIETNLMQNGLVLGCDWRDTMEKELGNKPLLTNNCLLYRVYQLAKKPESAETLRERIWQTFYHSHDHRFIDYPGNHRFDPLGGAFMATYNMLDDGGPAWKNQLYNQIATSFDGVDTDYGVTIKCRHNPTSDEEREVIERTDGVVVWPFVVGFAILALLKADRRRFAKEQFQKLTELEGFREWYDPSTGKGYGAQEQLWSATLYLRAYSAMAAAGLVR